MRCYFPLRRRGAKLALAFLLPVLALLAGTPQAEAVSIYFTGPNGIGVSRSMALATGLPIFNVAPSGLTDIGLKIITPNPVTQDTKATSDGTRSDPATGTTDWKVINVGLGDPNDENLWLVFYSHSVLDPHYPNLNPRKLGLEISGPDWAFFNPPGAPEYFLPALYLGDMDKCTVPGAPQKTAACPADSRALAHIQYRVLRDLKLVEGTFMYPQYWTGRVNAPIPEPSSVLLFAAGVVGLAASRRRRC
jgi:hypothetical protein